MNGTRSSAKLVNIKAKVVRRKAKKKVAKKRKTRRKPKEQTCWALKLPNGKWVTRYSPLWGRIFRLTETKADTVLSDYPGRPQRVKLVEVEPVED